MTNDTAARRFDLRRLTPAVYLTIAAVALSIVLALAETGVLTFMIEGAMPTRANGRPGQMTTIINFAGKLTDYIVYIALAIAPIGLAIGAGGAAMGNQRSVKYCYYAAGGAAGATIADLIAK